MMPIGCLAGIYVLILRIQIILFFKSNPCNNIEAIASISNSFGNLKFYISTVDWIRQWS